MLSWFGKLSPDREFVEEVVRVFATVVVEVDRRGRGLDWGELVFEGVAGVVGGFVACEFSLSFSYLLWDRLGLWTFEPSRLHVFGLESRSTE